MKHLALAHALERLKSQRGITIADFTPDELAEFVLAAERVDNPFGDVNADAAGFPVRVCEGVYFWRLTLGASIWLDTYAEKWWPTNSDKYKQALIYALMNGRDRAAFIDLDTERAAKKAIRESLSRISATAEEVTLALDIVFRLKADTREKKSEISTASKDWAAMIRRLESQSGIKAEEWLWDRSANYVVKTYLDMHDFAEAYSGGKPGHMRDELDAAHEALNRIAVKVMRRVKESGVSG